MADILISQRAQQDYASFSQNLQEEARSHLKDVKDGNVQPRFLRGTPYSHATRSTSLFFFWEVVEAQGRTRHQLLSVEERRNPWPG